MILYKLHPIFYTIGNSMGAPKENKGLEATPQLSKAQLYILKSSPISLSTAHALTGVESRFQALCLLLFRINKLGIAQKYQTTQAYPTEASW